MGKLSVEEKEQLKKLEEKMSEESVKRQGWIQKHVREYYKALNGDKLSPEEFLILGMDTILAGYGLVSRFSDMLEQGVEDRINTIETVRDQISKTLNGSYLNKDVVEQQVANTKLRQFKEEKSKIFKK